MADRHRLAPALQPGTHLGLLRNDGGLASAPALRLRRSSGRGPSRIRPASAAPRPSRRFRRAFAGAGEPPNRLSRNAPGHCLVSSRSSDEETGQVDVPSSTSPSSTPAAPGGHGCKPKGGGARHSLQLITADAPRATALIAAADVRQPPCRATPSGTSARRPCDRRNWACASLARAPSAVQLEFDQPRQRSGTGQLTKSADSSEITSAPVPLSSVIRRYCSIASADGADRRTGSSPPSAGPSAGSITHLEHRAGAAPAEGEIANCRSQAD